MVKGMTGNEIRQRFITFFEEREHVRVDSSNLIPRNDPTLMFTNAGMNQFKNYFIGEERAPFPRAVTAQKCVRAGGKHNDLENVGRTSRHHTFFEMLGNFSFGDYFKERAIQLAWSFLTEDLQLPAERLLATVYAEDDEAYRIWRDVIGLPEEKVIRIPTSDNFWAMGDTGPCGPCSELFYDHGADVPGGPPGSPDEDGDRFVEIWNLVFMQYNRDTEGTLNPLPNPCIDTGAGLERIAAILQGKRSNFDSDLFQPLIQATAGLSGKAYGTDDAADISLRVVADHLRAASFLIADGVLPSNEGRGYVLRRIMRRGMRHGRLLGLEKPFMRELIPTLTTLMGDAFPELNDRRQIIEMVVETEEKRFADTLGSGLKMLEDALAELPAGQPLSGETAFKLYDTYGFPVDLTADILRDRGLSVDHERFEACMNEQKARARAAWSGSGDEKVSALYHELRESVGASEFLGYETETAQGSIQALIIDGAAVKTLEAGQAGQIIVNQTPFYAESGGQVGDQGTVTGPNDARFEITDVKKPAPDLFVHEGRLEAGTLQVGDAVNLVVDTEQRNRTSWHHSATHYLHHALRQILGDHVKQAGSLVSPERLRFDFTHFQGLTPEELTEAEERVNAGILSNDLQETLVMEPEEAVAAGAMALFDEKYGEQVRVVKIGPTMELCGGTHVSRSGDIGLCRIISEGAVAAGVRRIEAVCGSVARASFQKESQLLRQTARMIRTTPDNLVAGLEKLLARQKELEKALEKADAAQAGDQAAQLLEKTVQINGISLLAAKADGIKPKDLRQMVDQLKDKIGSGVIFLGVPAGAKKVTLIAGVTKDLTGKVKAGDLMRFVAPKLGGKGGGRPDMAQGGGSQPENLSQVLDELPGWLEEHTA